MKATLERKNTLKQTQHSGYATCDKCDGLVVSDSEWLGEDESGKGFFEVTYHCEACHDWIKVIEAE